MDTEVLIRCEVCGQDFKRPGDLTNHNRFKHPDGVPAVEQERHPDPEPEPQAPQAPRPGKHTGPLKPYPFVDSGVNENAAIRMIKMVIPLCPADPRPEIMRRDGSTIANPRYTGEENCQQIYKFNNMGRWDVAKCESLGHDPWHTVFHKTIVEDVLDNDGWVIEQKMRVKNEKRLNVIQVSENPRHTSGTEVALAQARGARFLEDFGIASPCEFRNCSKPVTIETRFGRYCSERHARLVGADRKGVLLPIGGDPYTADQALEERAEMLENVTLQAKAVG